MARQLHQDDDDDDEDDDHGGYSYVYSYCVNRMLNMERKSLGRGEGLTCRLVKLQANDLLMFYVCERI